MGLFTWLSTAEGPLGVGDAVGSVLIIGAIFSLAAWGGVRNFESAFRVVRKECAAAPETAATRSKSAPESADEKLARLVSKPNHESHL